MKRVEPGAKYAAEFIGTVILVFVIACNIHTQSVAAAISVGFALTSLVYALGPLSGGHFNPAVSLAFFFVGSLSAGDLAGYIVSQVLGGLSAAALYLSLLGRSLLLEPGALYSGVAATAVEVIYSAALCYVFLGVTCSENDYFGLAVGSTVTAAAIAIAPISGCCLNPAVAAGSILVAAYKHGAAAVHYHGMYLTAPFLGAAVAAVFSTLAGNVRRPEVADAAMEETLSLERGQWTGRGYQSTGSIGNTADRLAALSPVHQPARIVPHESFRIPTDIIGNDLLFGCRWLMRKDTARGTPVEVCDVDLACAVFDETGACVRGIYFAEKHDPENGLQHLGDEVLGGSPRKASRKGQDNETIKLKLSSVRPDVCALVFTVMIYSENMNFGEVRDFCVRLIDVSGEHREVCRFQKKDLPPDANTLICAMVYRDGPFWAFKAVDEAYELPSHSTYRKLIPEMQEHVRSVLPKTPSSRRLSCL